MTSWEHWQTLFAVYRRGTYASAATSLGINATTVGRRIKFLEQRLGHSLFLRIDGKLVPTASCTALFPHLESVSESLRTAEHEAAMPESASIWRDVAVTSAPFLISNQIAPGVSQLVGKHRVRVELLGTGNNISITRREANISDATLLYRRCRYGTQSLRGGRVVAAVMDAISPSRSESAASCQRTRIDGEPLS